MRAVSIKLDKERKIRFTVEALMEIEEMFGIKYFEIKPETFGLKDIVRLLWLGLKHEDESLTYEDTVKILNNAESLSTIFEKVAGALSLAFVGKETVEEKKASST